MTFFENLQNVSQFWPKLSTNPMKTHSWCQMTSTKLICLQNTSLFTAGASEFELPTHNPAFRQGFQTCARISKKVAKHPFFKWLPFTWKTGYTISKNQFLHKIIISLCDKRNSNFIFKIKEIFFFQVFLRGHHKNSLEMQLGQKNFEKLHQICCLLGSPRQFPH